METKPNQPTEKVTKSTSTPTEVDFKRSEGQKPKSEYFQTTDKLSTFSTSKFLIPQTDTSPTIGLIFGVNFVSVYLIKPSKKIKKHSTWTLKYTPISAVSFVPNQLKIYFVAGQDYCGCLHLNKNLKIAKISKMKKFNKKRKFSKIQYLNINHHSVFLKNGFFMTDSVANYPNFGEVSSKTFKKLIDFNEPLSLKTDLEIERIMGENVNEGEQRRNFRFSQRYKTEFYFPKKSQKTEKIDPDDEDFYYSREKLNQRYCTLLTTNNHNLIFVQIFNFYIRKVVRQTTINIADIWASEAIPWEVDPKTYSLHSAVICPETQALYFDLDTHIQAENGQNGSLRYLVKIGLDSLFRSEVGEDGRRIFKGLMARKFFKRNKLDWRSFDSNFFVFFDEDGEVQFVDKMSLEVKSRPYLGPSSGQGGLEMDQTSLVSYSVQENPEIVKMTLDGVGASGGLGAGEGVDGGFEGGTEAQNGEKLGTAIAFIGEEFIKIYEPLDYSEPLKTRRFCHKIDWETLSQCGDLLANNYYQKISFYKIDDNSGELAFQTEICLKELFPDIKMHYFYNFKSKIELRVNPAKNESGFELLFLSYFEEQFEVEIAPGEVQLRARDVLKLGLVRLDQNLKVLKTAVSEFNIGAVECKRLTKHFALLERGWVIPKIHNRAMRDLNNQRDVLMVYSLDLEVLLQVEMPFHGYGYDLIQHWEDNTIFLARNENSRNKEVFFIYHLEAKESAPGEQIGAEDSLDVLDSTQMPQYELKLVRVVDTEKLSKFNLGVLPSPKFGLFRLDYTLKTKHTKQLNALVRLNHDLEVVERIEVEGVVVPAVTRCGVVGDGLLHLAIFDRRGELQLREEVLDLRTGRRYVMEGDRGLGKFLAFNCNEFEAILGCFGALKN